MTPNIALNLSEDGITLLHRAADGAGWVEVGHVALDDPDLGGGLARLRDQAQALEGPGFATKLILPPSQLLYATIQVEGDLTAGVESALEARTPYKVEQLSYDVSGDAPDVQVVAVARDTLAEAEDFIAPHGFNPVGFTAIPDPDHFDGEPNLGGMPSKGGTGFETDPVAVAVITAAEAEAVMAKAEAEKRDEEAKAKEKAKEEAEAKKAAAERESVEAKMKAEAKPPEPEPEAKPAAETEPEPQAEAEETTPPASPAAFSSRRRPSLGPANDSGNLVTSRAPRIAISADERRSQPAAKKPPKVEPRIKTGEAAKPKPTPPLVPPAPVQPAPSATPKRAKPSKKAKAKKSAAGLLKGVSGLRAKPASAKPAAAAPAGKADPIAELAARQAAGKPRFLGLILTGILLVALMLFAALSSYLLPEDAVSRLLGREEATPEFVAALPEVSAPEAVASIPEDEDDFPSFTIPSPEEIAEAEVPEPEILPEPVMDATEAQTAYAVSGIWQLAPDLRPAVVDQTLDALYDSSLDPDLAFEDAPALAAFDPAAQALSFAQPGTPPAAEIMLNLDSRGLVRPSPEGSLNPGGIFVFSGPPPVAAVPRPDGLVPLAEITAPDAEPSDAANEEAEVATETTEEDGPRGDPALAGFKPRPRPADLTERFERANQGGRSTSELAQIRPLPRPESAQARARQEAIARALAEAAAEEQEAEDRAAAEAAAQAEVDRGTAQAVASSVRPDSRPRNFSRIVARARQAPPETRNAAAAASTAQPSLGSGPAVARASRANPTGPTRASVARAATDNNALALGKVALVGVFGTASNRRALVRMPNGRFKKVAVGDRVDGGRVAAIGEGQLKYKKGSRTVTLQMPKG